jgi:Fructose-bisphosphate aldolase class-II
MFVTKLRLFFDFALRNHFAVPSFNVCNLETARAVIVAAEAEDALVMLQSYFGDLYYGGLDVLPEEGFGQTPMSLFVPLLEFTILEAGRFAWKNESLRDLFLPLSTVWTPNVIMQTITRRSLTRLLLRCDSRMNRQSHTIPGGERTNRRALAPWLRSPVLCPDSNECVRMLHTHRDQVDSGRRRKA